MTSSYRDLGKMFGVAEKRYADLYNIERIGPDLGLDITWFGDHYPRYMEMLQALGWNNTDILARTKFTCDYNEAALYDPNGYFSWPNFNQNRTPIAIPSGYHFYNSELRSGQHFNIGDGPSYNYSQGGTTLARTDTSWKSIHGAQNNGVAVGMHGWVYGGENNATPANVAVNPAGEWNHHFGVYNMAFVGTMGNSSFYNAAAKVEIPVMMYAGGEICSADKLHFRRNHGIGLLVSHRPAPVKIGAISGEGGNAVAILGLRDCANSNITVEHISSDMNPYAILMFRGGSNCLGTGSFLPHASGGNPGGVLTVNGAKIEHYECSPGYPGHSACSGLATIIPGRGDMLAGLTGRFTATFNNVTANNHEGVIDCLMEVTDDFAAGFGGIPLDNSVIEVNNLQAKGTYHWLHEKYANRKHVLNALVADNYRRNFFWQANENGGLSRDHKLQTTIATIGATYRGRQPFINQAQSLVWNHNAVPPPGFNYNVITGVNY